MDLLDVYSDFGSFKYSKNTKILELVFEVPRWFEKEKGE